MRALAASSLLLTTTLFCGTSQASLTNIGNGLIYDSTSNVTWISDGYAFTNNIKATTGNPTSDPYTGPLLGTVVPTPGGSPHTIVANDLMYDPNTGARWFGSWWAATAWADSYTYQYGSQTISDWRLPTSTEAQNLITQLGSGSGAKPPFTFVPPFYWTSNVTNSGNNADVARPLFGTINNFTLMNGAVPRYSNVWAVVPGNVAVPVPAAIWLFGSALAGMGIVGRRKEKATA
jgi:hypothetical protein